MKKQSFDVKSIIKNSFTYLLKLIVSLLLGLLFAEIIIGLIGFLIGASSIIKELRALTYLIIACAGLFLLSYRSAYKNASVSPLSDILSGVLMSIYQLIIAKIFQFVMYVSGAAYYASQVLYTWRGQETATPYDIPDSVYITFMLIFDVFYIAAIVAGGYLGMQKRLKERKELTETKNIID